MLCRGILAVLEADGAGLNLRKVLGSRAEEMARLWAWAGGCVHGLK